MTRTQELEIKNRASAQNLVTSARLVLDYLIDRSDKLCRCFPSITTMSKFLNLSVSTIKRRLKDLLYKGLIAVEHRFRENNSQTSNFYTIVLEPIEVKDTPKENAPAADKKKNELSKNHFFTPQKNTNAKPNESTPRKLESTENLAYKAFTRTKLSLKLLATAKALGFGCGHTVAATKKLHFKNLFKTSTYHIDFTDLHCFLWHEFANKRKDESLMTQQSKDFKSKLFKANITSTSKLLFCFLMDNSKDNKATDISLQQIAAALKLSPSTVRRLLRELTRASFITIQHNYNQDNSLRTNTYSLFL